MNPGLGDWVQTHCPFVRLLLSHPTAVLPCGKPGRGLRQSPVSASESLSVPSRTPSRDTLPRAALSDVLHRKALRSPAGEAERPATSPGCVPRTTVLLGICFHPGPWSLVGRPRAQRSGGSWRRLQGVPPGAGPGDETGHSAEENQSSEITLNMKCYSLL